MSISHTSAKAMAKQFGLELNFDGRSDCDVLMPPGEPDDGIWLTLRQVGESEFESLCRKMAKQINKATAQMQPCAEASGSEEPIQSIGDLDMALESIYTKLLKFQSMPLNIHKGSTASLGSRGSYRYADLPSVLEVVRPALSECGLIAIQLVDGDSLITRIVDAGSGEAIESRFHLPLEGLNWHGIGSAISYARRYALLSALSLAPADDDAAAAIAPPSPAIQAAKEWSRLAESPQPPPECPECGGPMQAGQKTGRLWCKPCYLAKKAQPV